MKVLCLLLLTALLGCSQQPVRAQYLRFHGGTGLPAQFWWDASVDTVDSYIVYCGLSSGTYTLSHDFGNTTAGKASDVGLTEGLTYYCVARSVASGVEGADSNEITICLLGGRSC